MATKSIVEKSADLRDYVKQFDVDSFCGFCAFFIRQKSQGELRGNITMFKSMQKDLTYLMALNYFNQSDAPDYFYTTEESIAHLATRVNDIKASYIRDSISELRMNVDRQYQRRAIIHEQIFHYFNNNGLLNYMEQEVNRIKMTYVPHDGIILASTGLSVQDFLKCFIALEDIQRKKGFESKQVYSNAQVREAIESLGDIENADDRERFAHKIESLPDEVKAAYFRNINCPHEHLKVSVDDLAVFCPGHIASKFLEYMSVAPDKFKDFTYYDQNNPLEAYPLLRIGKKYMHTNGKQLLVAINDFLFEVLKKERTSARAYRTVQVQLELQTRKVVDRFFSMGNSTIYQNYYIPGNVERDILIEIGPKVIICECKSTRLRRPLRDVDKFYTRARDDFKRSIQVGYDQALDVAELITTQEETVLYDRKGKEYGRVARRSPNDVLVWVVTDRSLGPAQVDLSYMLESDRALMDSWSISVDDLETFLLFLTKQTKQFSRLFDYLRFRPRLYGRVISPDELDLAGWYATNRRDFLEACLDDTEWVIVDLYYQNVFDKIYHSTEGLGFEGRLSERFWQEEDRQGAE